MDHYFNEWYKEQDGLFLSTVRDGAEAAWCYQQQRIDLLEDQVDGLENELHCVRAYNDELEAKMEWLQSVINNAMLPEGYSLVPTQAILHLDKDGFHYKGQTIDDTGEAYRLFMQWMNKAKGGSDDI